MFDNEIDILRDVSERLERLEIEFMLTGSLAMSFYAQPRMTRDVDLVVALDEIHTESLVQAFQDDYYVDPKTVATNISRRGMFNLIHTETVIKIDFVVLKSDPYRQEEFARRLKVTIRDFQTWIVTREDLILSKLYLAKDSKSEMQLRDVRNLLSVSCDVDYLHSRAEELGVQELLKSLK